ncbi:MAG TPA: ROK family protein [Verrucomicrobiae bacterium]|nr:ROK family protein [Verrucomicrobiae bacterium]
MGGTKLQIVVGDGSAKILQSHRFSVERDSGAAGIRQQIETSLAKIVPAIQPLAAVGVGFGGPVDWRIGKICRSHQIEGWSEFDLAGWLKALANAPVFVENDANVAALGEAIHGAGRNASPVFYLTLGSGVGGGFVLDGNIYHGATPGEAEIGHVRLDRAGTIVESRCSGWAVDAKIRALKTSHPSSALCKMIGEQSAGEARHLAAALAQKDAAAEKILRETAEDLAFGLSHVVHLFHPEVIVIGGGLANVGEPLRAAIESSLQGFIMDAFAPGPRICLTELGENAVPVGALQLAMEKAL